MASYRNYRVVLRNDLELKIAADDVCLDNCGTEAECQTPWFNFTTEEVTVAAIPFDQVRYIIS